MFVILIGIKLSNIYIYIYIYIKVTMLSGSTITTAWCVLGLRIEETASRYKGS
jgi:hypothetical protein